MHKAIKLTTKIFASNLLPYFTLLIIGFFIVQNSYKHSLWKEDKIVQNDVIMYYGYLPSLFIFDDMSLNYLDTEKGKDVRIWHEKTPHNTRYLKMPVGVAIMTSPFFLTAHAISKSYGLNSNGYNEVYYFFIVVSSWFYALLGLFFLLKSLRKLGISNFATALTLVTIALGTNFFFYSFYEVGMSHIYSFSLFSIIIYLTIIWHNKISFLKSILIGATIGLAVIVRPTNILITLFPLLYGIYSIQTLKAKFQLLKNNKTSLFYIISACFGVIFLQPFVWHLGTGEWIIYSYGYETFFFDSPNIIKGLFSFRKGMFIYSPILLLAIPGFYYLWKFNKEIFSNTLLYLIISVYIIFSWWCWWYGGSFGSRAMIENYVLLAIPIAFLINYALSKKILSLLVIISIIIGVKINLYLTKHYINGKVFPDSMCAGAYISLLKDGDLDISDPKFYSIPSYYNASLGNDESVPYTEFMVKDSALVIPNTEFANLIEMPFSDFFTWKYRHTINIEGLYKISDSINDGDIEVVLSLHDFENNKNYLYFTDYLLGKNTKLKEWNKFNVFFSIDYLKAPHATLKVYFWNKKHLNIELKNINIIKKVY